MGMSGPSREGGMMSEINVTPFVDVMLVLLIIFMVTAPMMTTGVEIALPKATAPPLNPDKESLVVSITAEETYAINKVAMPWADVAVKLKAFAESNPDQPVFVEADGRLPYEKVMQVLAIVKEAGVAKVGLVTQPGPVPKP